MYYIIHPISSTSDNFKEILKPLANMYGMTEDELEDPEVQVRLGTILNIVDKAVPQPDEVLINLDRAIISKENGKCRVTLSEKLFYIISEEEYKKICIELNLI